MDQNLTSFANSLSLSLSLVLPSYGTSPFELSIVCTDFIGKMISYRWESNAIRSPLIMKHICYGHSLLPLLQDWQLQVSGVTSLKRVKTLQCEDVTLHLPGYKWILLCYSLTIYTLITLSLMAYRAIFKTRFHVKCSVFVFNIRYAKPRP